MDFIFPIKKNKSGPGYDPDSAVSKQYETKVYWKLSRTALMTVELDLKKYRIQADRSATLSAFFRLIFKNYYCKAEASPNIDSITNAGVLNYIKESLYKRFGLDRTGNDVCIMNRRLDRETFSIMNNSGLGKLYDCDPGKYFQAVLEEYAKLSSGFREEIIFIDSSELIKEAINEGRSVYVKFSENEYEIYPNGPRFDSNIQHCYVLGVMLDGSYSPFRKRISRCSVRRGRTLDDGTKYKAMAAIDKLEDIINERDVPFFDSEIFSEPIRIRFTEQGESLYYRLMEYRPLYDRIEDEEKRIYVFNCTKKQMEIYFRKYGKEAEVLSPPEARADMKEFFEQSLSVYLDE